MANGTRITRFRTYEHEYVFDESASVFLQDWQDNFGDGVPDTRRMGGMNGGFDNYGAQPFPIEIGNVRMNVTLSAETEDEMTALLDGIRQMSWWGKGRLYMQPADPDADERWCWAKCQGITSAHNFKKHTDLMMHVPINFQVSDPYWYSQGSFPWLWGDGTIWGEAPWGGAFVDVPCAGLTTDFTHAREGNAPVRARVTVTTGPGETVQNFTVQRLASGIVMDEMKYTGILPQNSTLDLDAWAMQVLLDASNAYTTAFTTKRLDWFTLLPGNNSIRVKMANIGDACTVTIRNYEAWV
jgi:hypothetical protein